MIVEHVNVRVVRGGLGNEARFELDGQEVQRRINFAQRSLQLGLKTRCSI
jgi:hypothetical protein